MQPFVMVVDDDESVRTVLCTILSAGGRHVVAARDGAEALDRMRAGPLPELVLLDLMMPGMGGWQVLETMRESPRLAQVPVVILTAFGERDDLPASRTVIHKPVEEAVLRDLVDEILAQKRLLDSALDEPPSDLLPRRTLRELSRAPRPPHH